MYLRTIFIGLLLLASSQCKYEDQFGKVYDWKREGLGQTITTVFSSQTIFLLSARGFVVTDYVGKSTLTRGRTKLSVDVQFGDFAVDFKGDKIYFLSVDRLQVFEFSTSNGQFIKTFATDKG